MSRVIWIVLDSVGIGALPDAEKFGDSKDVSTLGNIFKEYPNYSAHINMLLLNYKICYIVYLASAFCNSTSTSFLGCFSFISLLTFLSI